MVLLLSKKRRLVIFAGIIAGMFLSSLTSTIVSTAMPKIISSLGGMEYLSWAMTSYLLTSTLSMPIFGKLADMYGRKPFYIGGIFTFIVGNILCGTATDMTQFIVYRAIAGLGGGIMQSNAMVLIADIFDPQERGKYQGFMGGVFGLSSIIGPTLGGFIVDNLSWNWVFWVNVPFGIIAIVILFIGMPASKLFERSPGKVDYLGVATLIAAFAPMLLAFSWAGTKYPWTSPEILGLLAFSLIALVSFIFIESKAAEPIVPLDLFKNRIFNVSVISGFLMSIAMFGTIMYIPMFVQGVLAQSASNSGMITMPLMLSLVVVSSVSGIFISKTSKYKLLNIGGFAIMLVGMVLLAMMDIHTSSWSVVLNMIVFGTGLGIAMPIMIIAVQNVFPPRRLGVATSTLQFFRSIGSSFGIAVIGSILNSEFKQAALPLIPDAILKMLPPNRQNIFDTPQALFNPQAVSKIKAMVPPQMQDQFHQLFESLRGALAHSIQTVFLVGIAVCALALIVSLFMKDVPMRRKHTPALEEAGKEMLVEGACVEGVVIPPRAEPEVAEGED